MRFRAICARTREPKGEFEAPNFKAAKVLGKQYEDEYTSIIVHEVLPATKPIQAVRASMPATEGDKVSMGVDIPAPSINETGIVFPFEDIENRVEGWLNASLLLPGGYRLVLHVHRGPRENLVGRWEVSFILVAPEPEKRAPGNGSSPGLPEGASMKDAG